MPLWDYAGGDLLESPPMEEIRRSYDAYRQETERALFLTAIGQRRWPALEEVDARFEQLSSGDALGSLRRERESAVSEAAQEAGRRLVLAVEAAVICARTRDLEARLFEREVSPNVRAAGLVDSVAGWRAALETQADSAQRRRIQSAIEGVWSETGSLREELLRGRAEVIRELGYASERAFAEARHPDIDYERWRRAMLGLLEATEPRHRDGLAHALSIAGVAPGEGHRADARYVDRFSSLDPLFPSAEIADCFDFTTRGMAIDLRGLRGVEVRLPSAEAPSGSAFSGCFPIQLPGEIAVLLGRRGGAPGYLGFFYAAGTALHAAFTSPELPVERRRDPDPALVSMWGLLFAHRIADLAWLEDLPLAARRQEIAGALRFRRLAAVRRCAGRALAELEWCDARDDGHSAQIADFYSETLTQATGYHHPPDAYRLDLDPELGACDELRAFCLEAQLSDYLLQRFGRKFWKERRAGDLLKELWNTGASYTAEQIAAELGLGGLGPELLTDALLA